MDLSPLPWRPSDSLDAPHSPPRAVADTLSQFVGQRSAPPMPHCSCHSNPFADNGSGRPSMDMLPSFPYTPQPMPGTLAQRLASGWKPAPVSVPGPAPRTSTQETFAPKIDHRNYNFGTAAPSRNLLFPANANITAVELLTFLPNSIHSGSVVYRLVTNGAKPGMIQRIVNTQRALEMEWSQSKCLAVLYDTMNRAGHKNWKLKIHATFHATFHATLAATWDETSISVDGFRTPGELRTPQETPAPDIPFKLLAVDVRRMPQGFDALDLTKMVRHCVKNPAEPWLYPRDWDALLGLVGGKMQKRKEHEDGQSLRRWKGVIAPPPGKNIPHAMVMADERGEMKKGREKSVSQMKDGMTGNGLKQRKQKRQRIETPRAESAAPSTGELPRDMSEAPRSQFSRNETPGSTTAFSDTASIPFALQPKKKRGRSFKIREPQMEQSFNDIQLDSDAKEHEEQNTHQLTSYVAPPADAIRPLRVVFQPSSSPDAALDAIFVREGQIDEHDAHSPYAFGGPRIRPPYRQLYRIEQPDADDCSGWAENLRWAFEQNTLFRFPHRPDAWNESPKHMEAIVEIRREQGWMSEELRESESGG